MQQFKVTSAERKVLKALGRIGTYIRVGDWRRTNCEIIDEKGIVLSFRRTTLASLIAKKLLRAESHRLTALGGEAAIKGYYTPGGDSEQREISLL